MELHTYIHTYIHKTTSFFILAFFSLCLISAAATSAIALEYQFQFKFGSYGTGDGEFSAPLDVAVDSANNIVVADTYNHRIQVFEPVVTTPTPTPSPEPSPSPSPSPEPSPSPQPSPTEPPTAIELTDFKAKVTSDGTVVLKWSTATEVDNAGFNIYRAESRNGSYTQVNSAMIPAKDNATSGARYRYEDTPDAGSTYYYKLEDVDYNGVSTMHGTEKVRVKSGSNAVRRR